MRLQCLSTRSPWLGERDRCKGINTTAIELMVGPRARIKAKVGHPAQPAGRQPVRFENEGASQGTVKERLFQAEGRQVQEH